jgi:tRNA1Val (adenine37-N6)-methyltransferase
VTTSPQVSHDALLAGRLQLLQPVKGYRAGMDAVLLGAAASGVRFESAVDVGCGVGAALLGAALASHHGRLSGIERDPAASGLAARNTQLNGLTGKVDIFNDDALAPADGLCGRFDLVFSNPPFFDTDRSIRAPAPERRDAWISGVPLEDWLKAMARLATPKGRLLVLHRADRLADILAWMKGRAGDVVVYPIRPSARQPAKRVLVLAQRGSRAPLRLLSGLHLHPSAGPGRFTPQAQAVFDGGPLPGWP